MPPPPVPQRMIDTAQSVPSFIARLIYFAVVPAILVAMSAFLPLTGVLVNLGLTVTYFLVSPYFAHHLESRPRLSRAFAKFRRFEEYYRETPPRTFAYYVFYAFLFPYWLVARRARREFFLYRNMGVLALLVIGGFATYQYLHYWRPIPFGTFAGTFIVVFIMQIACVLFFVAPIATTTLTYQLAGRKGRLAALYVLFAISLGTSITVRVLRRHDTAPLMTVARVKARMKMDPKRAGEAFVHALREVGALLKDPVKRANTEVAKDVKGAVELLGEPLEKARHALTEFYRADEAATFSLVALPDVNGEPVVVLFAADSNGKPVVFGGFDVGGHLFDEPARIGDDGVKRLIKVVKK